MDFDYTQAYTALNAEEVKVGDIVFIGLTPADLYEKVEQAESAARLICMVTEIQSKTTASRFEVKTRTGYTVLAPFVYMLHSKDSEFYDFAKAIYDGKRVWFNVDGKVTEQKSIVFDYPAYRYTLTDPFVYMLHSKDSEFYDFAKAIYDGKHVWFNADPNALKMYEEIKGFYCFNYKGFGCELAKCSGTDRYVCFVDYWDDTTGELNSDLVDWSWASVFDLGDSYVVPEFIIKRLDNWIKNNPSKKPLRRYE